MATRKFPQFRLGIVLFLLAVLGCKSNTDTLQTKNASVINFKTNFAIRSHIRKDVFDQKDNLPPDKRKLSSDIRELILQYQESKNSKHLSDSIISAEESTLSISPAIFDSSGNKVLVYLSITEKADSLSHLKETLTHSGITLLTTDLRKMQYVAWVPISELDGLTTIKEITYVRFVTPPTRMTDDRNLGRASIQSDAAEFIWGSRVVGSGVKVGVISDDCGSGTDRTLQQSLNNHYLSAAPTIVNPTALTHQQTNTHEGLGMLEIVHKLAPASQLYFASCGNSIEDMCSSIRAIAQSGCKVITDDIFFYDDPFFEDGDIAKTINDVTQDNHLVYIAAAGNTSRKVFSFQFSATDGSIFGQNRFIQDVVGGACPPSLTIPPLGSATVVLQWDDFFNSSVNDYDVVLINISDPNDVYFLDNPQNSVIENGAVVISNKPLELKNIRNNDTRNAKTYSINIIQRSIGDNAVPKMKLMIDLGANSPYYPQVRSVVGHSTAERAICCGAVNSTLADRCSPEDFSPIGPATMRMIEDNGRAMGGHPTTYRTKPDIASVDGIATTFRANFTGTSAAAPNAAGLAAQLLGAIPTLQTNQQQARQFILQGCIPYPDLIQRMGAGKTNTFKTIATALTSLPTSMECSRFIASPVEKVLTDGAREELTSIIDLSTAQTTLTQIHEAFVLLDLEFQYTSQAHSLKIELKSNDGKIVVLYDDATRTRSERLSTIFAIQNSNRTAAPNFGITIPPEVLNATTSPLQGTNPKQVWRLVITTDHTASNDLFGAPAKIYVQNWGLYFR